MGTEECCDDRRIPSNTLETLRGILISSLSRENLGNIDVQSSLSRRRKVTFQELHQVDAGAAPVDANQRPSSAHSNARSSTSNKDTNLLDHGAESDDGETLDGTSSLDSITDPGKETSGLSQKEREERIRALRDRQNDERQRKLEELKQQALAAQKFREQKEEERRRRIEELRQRDNDRRHQVEERKRQIWEAERDRREAILRKNQEREARIDSKRKNERSSIVFAFGSSTPRMLEPADTGGSFWGTRRATSTTNVMMLSAAPLTRRSSERELDGSKKRATSASGLDRKPGEDMKMSSSMYEVFHWNSTPEPTSKPIQRAKSLSYAPGSEPKSTPDKSDPHRTAPVVPTELNLNLDGRAHSFSSAPHTPSNRSVRIGNFLPGYGGFPGAGEEADGSATGAAAAAAVLQRVNRRKTDLMPTIPSPRDLTPTSSSRPSSVFLQGNRPFSRSPGRAYSMSRLDQLSQPRRRPAAELAALHEKTPTPNMLGSSPTTAKSMSRSMSHLATGGSGSRNTQRGSQLRRSDASRSMSQLSGSGQGHPVPLPRMTRAERLRQRAREMAVRNIIGSTGQLQGLRSGEVTPSPPSRPLSALSQQSMNSVNSGVSLRARPAAASRRPRPFSIAVTGVSHESDSQTTRTSHRHSIAGDIRTTKVQSSSIERENAKPPLPKVHSAKKPKSDTPMKKSTDKIIKSAKASPRVTPKATPLQSPGSEAAPPLSLPQEQIEIKEEVIEQKLETEVNTEEVSPEKLPDTHQQAAEVPKPASEVKDEVVPSIVETKPVVNEEEPQKTVEVEQKETKPIEPEPVQEETLDKLEAGDKSDLNISEAEVDMSASMIEKIRNRTEEEAKAALAERRRLAREQAEREAELERQRLEEEKRLEEERIRQEEEEQRRFEEEQLRLVEEARKAEDERLLQAIEENQRREEEERKRREEEAKAKAEKEESERKAREEAEKLRREMDERLKKEEEERIARRKRVEAIMLRTRGKGSPSSSPNASSKGDGDNEEGKDESPMEETKPHPGDGAAASGETQQPSSDVEPPAQSTLPATSDNITGNGQISQKQQSLLMDTFSSNIMDHIQENGGSEKKVSSSSSSDLLLIDNSNNVKPMETSEDLISSATSVLPPPQLQQSNGHRNGVEYGAVDFVSVDNVKQNNATNNLLDFSEFDAFSTNNVMMHATQPPTSATDFEQILDLSSVPTTGKLSNEDNVNSNVMNNGPAPPFIAFQDNLAKKTDTNSVTDLLS